MNPNRFVFAVEIAKVVAAPIGFAISIETPPVDFQFGNAANMFSNFLIIIANLDFC
jgi:hypothetical protein